MNRKINFQNLREINQIRTKDEYQANDFFEVESSVGSEKRIVQEPTVKLVRKEPRNESFLGVISFGDKNIIDRYKQV